MSLLAGFGLAACGEDPPAPSEVRSRITADLGYILREANAAFEGGTEELPGTAVFGLLDRALGEADSPTPVPVSSLRSVMQRVARLAPMRLTSTGKVSGGARPADPPAGTDEEIALLNEQVFSDDNYLGDGIYRIPASLVCPSVGIDPDAPAAPDPECAATLEKAQLRIRTSKDDGELQFALQVGAAHAEPLSIGLTHTRLAMTLDLDDAEQAMIELARLAGEDLPNVDVAGQVTAALEILGTAHAKATIDIDRALSLAFAEDGVDLAGPEAFRISSAKARVLALELNGTEKRGSFALGLGATKATLPLGDDVDRELVELDLAGLTGTAAFGPAFGAGQGLVLTGISLGDRTTKLSINGQTAATIDLNPDNGRAFDATITADAATGAETLAVTPAFDLRMAMDRGVLGGTAPVYDVTQIRLAGSLTTDETAEQLKVVTGSLQLATDPAQFGFTAAAGDCVTTRDATTPEGLPYTEFVVGVCL